MRGRLLVEELFTDLQVRGPLLVEQLFTATRSIDRICEQLFTATRSIDRICTWLVLSSDNGYIYDPRTYSQVSDPSMRLEAQPTGLA